MPQQVENAALPQGIVLENLSAGYQQQVIVDDISLATPPGKMSVLAGANGSGKSTSLRTTSRLCKPLFCYVSPEQLG